MIRRIVLTAAVIAVIVLIVRGRGRDSGTLRAEEPGVSGTQEEISADSSADAGSASCVLKKDGSLTVTSTETFDKSYYSRDELESAIDSAVSDYSKDGEEKVKKEHLTVSDGMASVVMWYASAGDYTSFNGTPLYFGSLSGAQDAGYSLDSVMGAVSQKDQVSVLDEAVLPRMADNCTVIITNAMSLDLPFGIDYASDNLKVTGSKKAEPSGEISQNSPGILVLDRKTD